MGEFASGGEEGRVGSEPEADVDSTGNEVVRGLERSWDSALSKKAVNAGVVMTVSR